MSGDYSSSCKVVVGSLKEDNWELQECTFDRLGSHNIKPMVLMFL